MKWPEDSEFVCITKWDENLYHEALSWVDEKRRVAIISDQERKSCDPRVQIYLLESPLQMGLIVKRIAWSAVLHPIHVIGEDFLKEELERCHLAAHLILSEAADYWVGAMKNARANDQPYRRGIDLKGAFHGIPALIVGAGPSLEQNGHLLRAFEKKALIFAGGSALNAIDVEPHFAASIDKDAPYRQFKIHPFSQTPFCYQARMSADNFALLHAEKILFPDSSCEPINWIYGEEPFDGGWTVGNFLTRIAIHMGCSPIVFVGMDLCYKQGRKYAKIEADLPEGLIHARDALVQKDWLMAAEWTEKQEHPFIDASEGILDLAKMKLEKVLESFSSEWDLRKLVHEKIQELPLIKTDRWSEWDASLKRCQKQLELSESEIVYQKLLSPLWNIWRPVFERIGQRIEIHRKLFFEKVLEEYVVLSER